MPDVSAHLEAMELDRPTAHLSKPLLWSMATAAAVAVANLYYNQPMLADMMRTFAASPRQIGLVATATQVGYAAGMPLFVPLGDLLERRRLIVLLFLAVAVALAAAGLAPRLSYLVLASFAIGVTTVIAQIMIPLAAELSTPAEQGHTVGIMLSGVLTGILLARTLSGVVSHHLGWRTMYFIAAVMALAFAAILRKQLPQVTPKAKMGYGTLLQSLWEVVHRTPKLLPICVVAAMFFATFSAFWTTLVFLLETPPYHYGSQVAGMFGLVGLSGVTVAPIAGRLSDRRSPRFVVAYALLLVFLAFVVFRFLGFQIWGLIVGVVLLDAGVQAAQVANQSRVLGLRPEARNRVNTVYMIAYFSGGSMGSLLGSWAWSHWGWNGVCLCGIGFVLLAALVFTQTRVPSAPGKPVPLSSV